MFDTLGFLYEGQYSSATFLQLVNFQSIDCQQVQFGGIGPGTYTVNATVEQFGNFLAPNRLDVYRRFDTMTQSVAIGATSIQVHDGTRFKVGQVMAFYDGVHYDTPTITGISGNVISYSPANASAYALGTTVMVLIHTGRISSIGTDTNLQNIQNVQTQGYFQQLNDFIENGNVAGYECGWVIYNTLLKYADSLNLVIESSNFVQDSTGLGTGGTGVYYTATAGEQTLLSFLQDVVTNANANTNGITYVLYADEQNVLHFTELNTSTVTVSYDIASYGTNNGDGIYDCVLSHQVHDQDLTTLTNTYQIIGGNASSTGTAVQAIVFDQDSVNIYGQFEQTVTNTGLVTTEACEQYGQALLAQTAYPARQYMTEIYPSRTNLTIQDYIKITGFTDGSTQRYSPLSINLVWDATQDFSQFHTQIKGAEVLPNINRIMSNIAAEHYIPVSGVVSGSVSLTNRFVQNGLQGSYALGGTTFTVSSGQLNCNVLVSGTEELLTAFTIPQYTFTPTADDTYTVAYWYANTDGTQVTSPTMVSFAGTSAPVGIGYSNNQIVPLWLVTRLGGVIVNATDLRNEGGIKQANINPGAIGGPQLQPNPNLYTAPALKSGTSVSTVTYSVTGGGSYDAGCTFTLSITNPSWLAGVRMYGVPAGDAYANYRVVKGDLSPTSSGTYSFIGNFPSGQAYDIYCCFVDLQSNESQTTSGTPIGLKLCTTNPVAMASKSFPSMPSGTIPVESTTASSIAYPNVGNATYDAQVSITLSNGSTAEPWLGLIQAIAQPSNQSSNWSVYNTYAINDTGIYSIVWGGLGAGNSYTLALRYLDFQNNESNVLNIGTTSANPIQSSAIGTGAVGIEQTTGIFTNNQMNYSLAPPAIQNAVNSNGTVNAPVLTGTVPVTSNSPNVQGTIGATTQAGVSTATYLLNSAVSTNQVQQVAIIPTQLAATVYDTSTANTTNSYNGYAWYLTSGPVAGTLPANASITYNVGAGVDTSGNAPATNTMTLPASGVATLTFDHNQFKAGGNGTPLVSFVGSSVSAGSNVLTTSTISGADQPSITNASYNSYSNVLQQHTIASTTSTPSITQAATPTTYTPTLENSGYLNNGGASTAYITGTGFYGSITPVNLSLSVPVGYVVSGAIGIDGTTTKQTLSGNSYQPGATTATFSSFVSSAYPLTLNYTLPSSINAVYAWSTYTMPNEKVGNTTVPAGSTTTAYPCTWTMYLEDGSGGILASWSSLSGASSVSYSGSYNGTLEIKVVPTFSTDSGDTTAPDGSYEAATSFIPDTNTYGVIYDFSNGAYELLGTYNCVAPTSAGTQIAFNVTATDYYSNTYGSCTCTLVIERNDGSGHAVINVLNPSGTYTYYNASETCTSFNVYMYATISTINGNSGTTSEAYNPNLAGNFSYYANVANPVTYTYPATNGGSSSFFTDNNSDIVAPTTSSTPVGVVISSLTKTSNTYGASNLYLNVYDPNGNEVVTAQEITATGVYAYSNSAAIAGQYQFVLYGAITTNNSNTSGTQSFPVTYAGYTFDYNSVNAPYTVYTDNVGTASYYLTSTNSIAPTTAGSCVILNLTSVTTDTSGTYGTNYIVVRLKNPSGSYVTDSSSSSGLQYSLDGGSTWNALSAPGAPWITDGGIGGVYGYPVMYRYFNSSAAQGVWQWVVYGQAGSNNTSAHVYADSWTGTIQYYIPGVAGGNTYIIAADGVAQRTAANDANILFETLTPTGLSFQVFNNASQSVTFTVGVSVTGV